MRQFCLPALPPRLLLQQARLRIVCKTRTAGSDKCNTILPNPNHEPYISDPDHFKSAIIDFVMQY